MQVITKCPFCGKTGVVNVNQKEMYKYRNGTNIVEAFPRMKACDREMLISGICYKCQEKMWNRPCENASSWGDELGECPICGRAVWSIHDGVVENEPFQCQGCYQQIMYNGSYIEEVYDREEVTI